MPNLKRFLSRFLSAYCAIAVALLTGCHRNISGAYLASDNNSLVWLQLVRTPDNHLTGQLATTALKPNGAIEQNSTSITGAVDGENVTIQGSRFLGLESLALSGTLKGNVLTLTGAQSIPLTFARSTLGEFQTKVAELNTRSQKIIQARDAAQSRLRSLQEEQKFVAEIALLIRRMQQFDSQADIHLRRFPGAEKEYEAITAKIAAYVARERQLAGNSNAAVARGQLSVAAYQTSLLTEQLHNHGQSLHSSLETEVRPMADKATSFEHQCRAISQTGVSLTPDEVQRINAACNRLESAGEPFRQKYAAMSAGLAHLEKVYQNEHGKQQQLMQTADRLQ